MSITSTRQKWLALLMVCVLSPAVQAWDASEVVSGLARHSADAARFTEIKYLQALDRPLRQDGEVRFTPPDGMEKIVTSPYEERMTVSAGWLKLQRGKKISEVELERHPVVQAFVTAFIATLAGDIQTLETHYNIVLEGQERAWTIILTPRKEALLEKVNEIRVSGNADMLQAFETKQPNGDRSIMYFSSLPTGLSASPAAVGPALEQ